MKKEFIISLLDVENEAIIMFDEFEKIYYNDNEINLYF